MEFDSPRVFDLHGTTMAVLFIVSNLVITACYIWIPLVGGYYWHTHRRGFGNHGRLLMMYSVFILFHGLCRLNFLFHYRDPLHWLNLTLVTLTAMLAIWPTFKTKTFFADIVKLPSRQELHDALDRANNEKVKKLEAEADKNDLVKRQEEVIVHLQEMLKTTIWLHDKERAMEELHGMIARLKAPCS